MRNEQMRHSNRSLRFVGHTVHDVASVRWSVQVVFRAIQARECVYLHEGRTVQSETRADHPASHAANWVEPRRLLQKRKLRYGQHPQGRMVQHQQTASSSQGRGMQRQTTELSVSYTCSIEVLVSGRGSMRYKTMHVGSDGGLHSDETVFHDETLTTSWNLQHVARCSVDLWVWFPSGHIFSCVKGEHRRSDT